MVAGFDAKCFSIRYLQEKRNKFKKKIILAFKTHLAPTTIHYSILNNGNFPWSY